MLVRPTDNIVAIAVPCQGIGAQNIVNAVIFEFFLLCRRISKIAESDLAFGVDRLVDRVDKIVDVLILRLDAVGDRDIALESRRIVSAGQCQKL